MKDGSVMRESDLAMIPPTEENADWKAYMADDSKVVEPFDYAAEDARQAAGEAAKKAAEAKAKLAEIDLRSIRAIREYIAAKPDSPQEIRDRETEAVAERTVIKR